MANNPESIEAQLAAFIDGELDAAGQAELEKHLAANPQHRALLDELTIQKGYVQALPREAAPPEMAETLQGHLERSVLLDGVGTADVGKSLHVNRWPQVFGIAAVVLLAAGLGVLVYEVLPSRSNQEPTYAIANGAKDKKDLKRLDAADRGEIATTVPSIGTGGAAAIEPTVPAAAAPAFARSRDGATSQTSQQSLPTDMQQNSLAVTSNSGTDAVSEVNSAFGKGPPKQAADDSAAARRVEVTLTSADPAAAHRLITRFCGERLYAIAPVLPDSATVAAASDKDAIVKQETPATLPSETNAFAGSPKAAASQPADSKLAMSPATQPGVNPAFADAADMSKPLFDKAADAPTTRPIGNDAETDTMLIRGMNPVDVVELQLRLAASDRHLQVNRTIDPGEWADFKLGIAQGAKVTITGGSPPTTEQAAVAGPATRPDLDLEKASSPTTVPSDQRIDLVLTLLPAPTTMPAAPTTLPIAGDPSTQPISATQPAPMTQPTTGPAIAPDPSVMP